MIFIQNNPIVSSAFKDEEVQSFLQQLFREMEDPYTFKRFLKDGWKKTYREQYTQLQKSFTVIEAYWDKDKGFKTVERCIDGARFSVGDMVLDLVGLDHPDRTVPRMLPIGRLYEDDRGLHVRLDVVPEPNLTLTWRDLSTIDHEDLYKARKAEYDWIDSHDPD